MVRALKLLFIWSAFKTNGTDVTFGVRASLLLRVHLSDSSLGVGSMQESVRQYEY